MKKITLTILNIFILVFIGCYPVSHIIVGEKRAPINSSEVKVYFDYPKVYEKVAIVEASSNFAFKDPSIEFSHQKKTDKALERLKNEAAKLGANGIIIDNLSSKTITSTNIHEDNKGRIHSSSNSHELKKIIAVAIFVD